jgi:hypothetical protein
MSQRDGRELVSWWTTDQVLGLLGIKRDALRALQADTPEAVTRPWVNVGGKRPMYRWRPGHEGAALWTWLQEVERWRRTRGAQTAGPSGGETPTGRAGADRSRTRRRGTTSSETSSGHTPRDGAGNPSAAEIRRSRR